VFYCSNFAQTLLDFNDAACYTKYDAVRHDFCLHKADQIIEMHQSNLEREMDMELIKKSFLFMVGAAAVAYEEAEKEVKKRRERIHKMLERAKPKKSPKTV